MKLPSLPAVTCSVALAAAFAFLGCHSAPYTPKADPSNAEIAGAPVVILDEDLRSDLNVDQNVLAQRNANNLLAIQVTLRNTTDDERLNIQVQTIFKDDNGRVLYSQTGSEPAWQPLSLSPGQVSYYTQSALTPEATRFTVRIRYAPRHHHD